MNQLNNHVVSRFLTKPWESGHRQLRYYDFQRKTFGERSSRNLFSLKGRHSAAVEARINRLVETPLAATRKYFSPPVSAGSASQPPLDWPSMRALLLLLPLQFLRSSARPDMWRRFEEVIGWDDDAVDQFALAVRAHYTLVRLSAHPQAPLHYPATGAFLMPVRIDQRRFDLVLTIPLSPALAVAAVPSDAEDIHDAIRRLAGGFLSNSSVGLRAERVVVHPACFEETAPETIAQNLEASRASLREAVAACDEFNQFTRAVQDPWGPL